MVEELIALRNSLHQNLKTLDELIQRHSLGVPQTALLDPMAKPDLLDPDWPAAWPQYLIANAASEQEKVYRAIQITAGYDLGLIEEKKILDFGCGDGLVAMEIIKRRTKGVLAYDIAPDKSWTGKEYQDLAFSSDLKHILDNAPYDTIIMHDVIDHVPASVFESAFKQLIDRCTSETRFILTAHPFTSRHGGHLHESKNLAFLQLLYSEDELAKLQIRCPYNNRWSRPQAAYENMFNRLNLKIVAKEIDTDPVEQWIIDRLIPIITKRIYDNQITHEQTEKIMSVSWVQYTLAKGQ